MSGKTSPEEERTLLAWFSDSDHKEEIMAFYMSRWEESSGKKLPPKLQGQMFCEIKKRIRQEKKTLEIKKKPHTLWKWLSYAAVAFVCISLGIGSHWYYMRQVPLSDPLDYVVSADNGQRASVVLPDGTKVWLNSHTKLNYKSDYGVKERSVSLSGEAYFEVVQDESHPFVVQTHLGEVMVLGTAFNVNAYTNASVCYTTLVRGKVQFSAPNVGTVTLQPGEQAVVSANGTEKRTVDLDEYIGWVNGVYNFKNRSLGEIMETFERWYDIQVYYETPDLRDITYSGSLKRYGAVNSFLDALELTGDLTYKISGRKVLIYDGMKE